MNTLNEEIKGRMRRHNELQAWLRDAKKEEQELRDGLISDIFGTPCGGSFESCYGDLEIRTTSNVSLSLRDGAIDEFSDEQLQYALDNFLTKETIYKIDEFKYQSLPEDTKQALTPFVEEKVGKVTLEYKDHRGGQDE